ncbi:MAG: glycoside hydrolase family 43 protein [Clostridia bacterium]|nr:glycoside hydrolase family 43 protein [Clostridia bacterium]
MENTYCNPLKITGIGDPFVLRASDGFYYLYATSAKDGFLCWKSEDLVNWDCCGYCYKAGKNAWGERDFWAPECYEINGKFYFFYSAHYKVNPNNELENYCIGCGVADAPTGPFTDILGDRPLIQMPYATIDMDLLRDDKGNVVFDADGNLTLYFSRCCYKHKVGPYEEAHIYAVKLAADCTHIIGEPICVLKPDQEWEGLSAPTTGRRWCEGPLALLHDGKVYIMYSGNFFKERYYAIGCATADDPMGPFVKYEDNPVMHDDYPRVSGPGHNSVAWSPDGTEMFIVYHIHTDAGEGGFDRQVCIDRMGWDENGKLYCTGPSTTPQKMPSR